MEQKLEQYQLYETILVPLDGSKRAEGILTHVESLAQRYRAKVIFVQVIEPYPLVVLPDMPSGELHRPKVERIIQEAQTYLATLQGEFREKGIEAETEVVSGPVVSEILNAADKIGASLIAMTSHGRTGLSRVFYGSVAAGVLNRIDRPLLIIRA
jgi:nucleotide-binding universal stress UspA family protein